MYSAADGLALKALAIVSNHLPWTNLEPLRNCLTRALQSPHVVEDAEALGRTFRLRSLPAGTGCIRVNVSDLRTRITYVLYFDHERNMVRNYDLQVRLLPHGAGAKAAADEALDMLYADIVANAHGPSPL